ncbi:MAG: hypothetical protein HY298_18670 [Verrucomicrobia bacterium]|nr:hypothetical protein [Verrucomicrobiota bacterium]
MNKHISQIITFATITRLTACLIGCCSVAAQEPVTPANDASLQPEFPVITRQPVDQAILLGSTATFTAQAVNGAVAFQWLRNGVPIEGQTNSSLILENIGIDDVGYYSADISNGGEPVPTRSASLNVYSTSDGGTITVFGLPVVSSGSSGTCPGPYAGYVNYIKTVSQGWGWAPTVGTTVHTASDLNRTDTKVVYIGKFGDGGCNQTTVTVPDPTLSPKYRFSIYFTNNVPTNSYPITLTGFDP